MSQVFISENTSLCLLQLWFSEGKWLCFWRRVHNLTLRYFGIHMHFSMVKITSTLWSTDENPKVLTDTEWWDLL